MNAKTAPQVFDITFIGAGPTGLFGAFYAGLRELSVKVIESLPQAGGQLSALYPEKKIYDVPGFSGIQAKTLVANQLEQTMKWKPAMALGEQASMLERITLPGENGDEQVYRIGTDVGEHFTRTVVITAGIGAFRPMTLNDESINAYEGRGLTYMVQKLEDFAGRKVLIVGGGDSAVDWALALEPIAEQVTLIHRREGFRAHDSSVNALNASKVDVRIYYELRQLLGENQIEQAIIFDNRSGEETNLEIDDLILALGFKADMGPIRSWGLETIGRRYVKVNSKMQTNLPGVFAAGDVALEENGDPLNLIVVGYGQVTIAVNYAYTVIKPGGKVFPGHSSEKSE